ncbi:hypothetical protein BH23ACT9_BH23ACT9_18070 [soil metagenome]
MEVVTPWVPGYAVAREIGRGGFGVVYLADAQAAAETGAQSVAVKVLNRVLDVDATKRFQGEVQAMGTLAWHPNIISIIDAGTTAQADTPLPFIVMEYLPDGSLGDRLRAGGPLDPQAVSAWGIQAATALQVAHNAGLLHRDVKPDNLLLASDGSVKLSDFGVTLAASTAGVARGTTGTVAFSAPELLAGEGASPASDVYALGATLFALLRGEPAFARDTDESPAALILRAYREPVADLRQHGVPDPLARVVERAIAKDPAARPQAAQDLALELQSARQALSMPPVTVAGSGRPVATAALAPGSGLPDQPRLGLPDQPPLGLPDQPPPEQRRRARRMQRVLTGVGAVAAALVAVTFVAVSDLSQFGTGGDLGSDAAPPPAEAPPDSDPADSGAVDSDPTAAEDAEPAEDPPLGAPAPPPALPPAPTPVPQPVQPDTGPVRLVETATLGAEVVGGLTATDSVVIFATATEVVRVPLDGGGGVQSTPIAGVTSVAATEAKIALTLQDGSLVLLDEASLTQLEVVDLAAAEVVAADKAFWVAGREGLVEVDADGNIGRRVQLRGAQHVAAAEGVVWAATGAGQLVAVDPSTGSVLAATDIGTGVAELAATPGGGAVVVTADGRLVTASARPRPVPVPDVTGATDVAVTDGGRILVLVGGEVLDVTDGGTRPTGITGAVRLWDAGPDVAVGLADPRSVRLVR